MVTICFENAGIQNPENSRELVIDDSKGADERRIIRCSNDNGDANADPGYTIALSDNDILRLAKQLLHCVNNRT